MTFSEPLPSYLAEPSLLGDEIAITGKWVPSKPGGRFRTTEESREMLQEWEDIHQGARTSDGVLSTEINHAVGEDAALVHHVFENPDALIHYFSTTATEHMAALTSVAVPDLHLVRGVTVPPEAQAAVEAKGVDAAFGEYLFGFVKDDYRMPDPATAINVTAKWTAKPRDPSKLDELIYWWQRVATDAFDLEEGMLRFEAYRVIGEDALIIHEVFDDTGELKFHLTKGTADRYKKDIDEIAEPERYFFRGPVSWTIRTYSRFMHLPATYSSRGSHFTHAGGSMIDGTTPS
jgi:quinol monooxygenase YgiN